MSQVTARLWRFAFALFVANACCQASEHAALTSQVTFEVAVAPGLLDQPTDGHLSILLSPDGTPVLNDTLVASTPDHFFGMNVFKLRSGDNLTLSGGGGQNTSSDIYGWPVVSLDDIPRGNYTVRVFLNKYETAKRSDGSEVSLRFPCGDGQQALAGPGSLLSDQDICNIHTDLRTIRMDLNNTVPPALINGTEIGGCFQGNFEDRGLLRYAKIRSATLSKFWGRDMYVGATVLLPPSYAHNDSSKRYPVLYQHSQWGDRGGAFSYPWEPYFKSIWDAGEVPSKGKAPPRKIPPVILVKFRHVTPYADNSYAVNSANVGPYGDALNDELIPHLDEIFHTIARPHARILIGVSTGGWSSVANVVFRPDLFGACFARSPDPLDFDKMEEIPLYTSKNAYVAPHGSPYPSIRGLDPRGHEVLLATVAQENHQELTFGTSSRSTGQWDVWNTVYGAQGLNGYPLEAWDKVTGEIFPEAVEYWKPFDLTWYVLNNWNNERNLGAVLRGRISIIAGSDDDYYLNEAAALFRDRLTARGGSSWTNVTIIPGGQHHNLPHTYNGVPFGDFFDAVHTWIQDHAPDGKTPLLATRTAPSGRGNLWDEVIARGGHQAALARQASPTLETSPSDPDVVIVGVGRWDPGVKLELRFIVDGRHTKKAYKVVSGQKLNYTISSGSIYDGNLQVEVTGRKRGYVDEVRRSEVVATTGR